MESERRCLREILAGEPSRRRALELILGGALGAVALKGAFSSAHATARQEKPQAAPGEPVGKVEELPQDGGVRVSHRGRPILLVNVEGEVRAFLAICTHEGCVVGWSDALKLIQCPCHDGRYDREGQVVSGPPPSPLLRLEVAVRDGTIYLVEKKG